MYHDHYHMMLFHAIFQSLYFQLKINIVKDKFEMINFIKRDRKYCKNLHKNSIYVGTRMQKSKTDDLWFVYYFL